MSTWARLFCCVSVLSIFLPAFLHLGLSTNDTLMAGGGREAQAGRGESMSLS